MKKYLLTATALLLALNILSGCSKTQTEAVISSEPSTASAETEHNRPFESDASYMQQIERYYTAISSQWDESAYFDQEMSAMVVYYYEGNALDNIGFQFMDLDGDNVQELIIGAIKNAKQDPLVFEIWTLKNGVPTMLVQSGSHNRYYLQYTEEDNTWTIAYEAENGTANRAVYYLQLSGGKLEVVQGVLFDAIVDENAPWFMTYDLDWDTSNDVPIEADTANSVMQTGRNIYTEIEYFPYSMYK